MAQQIDTLISPKWLIPIEPHSGIISDHSIAFDKGKILAVLPSNEALRYFEPNVIHERPSHVVLPGLVNTHTHAAMTLLRGLGDDLPLQRWLEEKIWPAEMRLMGSSFVRDGTQLAIAEMIQGGITCFADMYFYPEHTSDIASEMGIRMVVGMIAIDFPTPWAANSAECINKGLSIHDAYKQHELISTMFAPHAPYTVSDDTLIRIRQLADELDVPVQIHIHETRKEIDDALEKDGVRPLERLNSLGLVNPNLLAVHATQLTEDEISLLAQNGCTVIHCPRSNLKLASGACPVQKLISAGVNVSLGTDGAASNNQLNLWSEMNIAALFGKFIADDTTALSAIDILRCATINGARALGLDQVIGSLEVGKSADLICVDLNTINTQPVLDPLSQLIYASDRHNVTDSWIAGNHLLKGRELIGFNTDSLLLLAKKWTKKVLS